MSDLDTIHQAHADAAPDERPLCGLCHYHPADSAEDGLCEHCHLSAVAADEYASAAYDLEVA